MAASIVPPGHGSGRAASEIVSAVRRAAERTGADFRFLLAEAAVESGLKRTASAKDSSARGLYQFIERTWLDLVREHGAKYGLAQLADRVRADGSQGFDDPALRARVLALREDPSLSAAMAAELAVSNRRLLEKELGARAEPTDLYVAHFLGAGQAVKFLRAHREGREVAAADLVPAAAQANAKIFYGPDGAARSVGEVYAMLDGRLDRAAADLGALKANNVASRGAPAPSSPLPAVSRFTAGSLISPYTIMALAALELPPV